VISYKGPYTKAPDEWPDVPRPKSALHGPPGRDLKARERAVELSGKIASVQEAYGATHPNCRTMGILRNMRNSTCGCRMHWVDGPQWPWPLNGRTIQGCDRIRYGCPYCVASRPQRPSGKRRFFAVYRKRLQCTLLRNPRVALMVAQSPRPGLQAQQRALLG
jgi:hypothetical protein